MTTPTTETDQHATLATGEYACLDCGAATRPDPSEPIVSVSVHEPVTPSGGRAHDAGTVLLTRCADCRRLRDIAAAVFARHAGARRSTISEQKVEFVLCGLAALGKSLPDPATITRREVEALLDRLTTLGPAVRWQSHARPRQCSPQPWAHVTDEVRAELRTEYAAVMAERMAEGASSVALAPPPPTADAPAVPVTGGCLLCGVRSLYRPAAEVVRLGGRAAAQREVWRPLTAEPASLGGRPRPTRMAGHLCPHCSDARDSVGSVGPTLRERAVMDHLRRVGRDDEAETLRFRLAADLPVKLPAWCVSGAEPSATPWAHITIE